MAKSRKMTTIPELVEDEKQGPEHAIAAVRKHLKSGTGDPYTARNNLLAGILDRNRRNEKLVAEAKRTQWRIANLSLLLSVAVTGGVLVSRHLLPAIWYTAALSAAAAVAFVLICWMARRMLDRTVEDLRYYREHARLNEEMLTMTVGIEKLATAVISARQPDFEGRRFFLNAAGRDKAGFAGWLYGMIVGTAVTAFAVSQVLAWLR
jgi:hypothetical protein